MGSYFGGGRQDTVQFTVQDLKFFSFVTDILRLGQSNIWSASIKRETYLIDILESKRKKRSRQSQVPKRFKCSANGPQNFSFQHSSSILDSLTFLLSKTNVKIGKVTRIWRCEGSNKHTFSEISSFFIFISRTKKQFIVIPAHRYLWQITLCR